MKSSALFLFCLLFSAGTLAQSPKDGRPTPTHLNWICLERVIPAHTVPEDKLDFIGGDKCRVVVPVADGETLQITPSGIRAADEVIGVFISVSNIMMAEQNKKRPEIVAPEIPHDEFGSTLIASFNNGKDSARAKFCAIFPLAYVPLLDWHGATEPKPCSDQAPRL